LRAALGIEYQYFDEALKARKKTCHALSALDVLGGFFTQAGGAKNAP